MLKFSLLNFKFFRFVNSGLYFDFFFKKISEIFVRNFFIYSALFFGEKFVIEVLTKKVITFFISSLNFKISKTKTNYVLFFYQVLAVLFYFFFIFNLIFFLINKCYYAL